MFCIVNNILSFNNKKYYIINVDIIKGGFMAKSKVLSVSIPEEMLPAVEAIALKEKGLSRWFQEKVRQYDSGVDLDAVEATLKDINEKMNIITQSLNKLKSDQCDDASGSYDEIGQDTIKI